MSEVILPQITAQSSIPLEASYRLLKKALNAEAVSVAQILDSLPQTAPVVEAGSSVGNHINLYA